MVTYRVLHSWVTSSAYCIHLIYPQNRIPLRVWPCRSALILQQNAYVMLIFNFHRMASKSCRQHVSDDWLQTYGNSLLKKHILWIPRSSADIKNKPKSPVKPPKLRKTHYYCYIISIICCTICDNAILCMQFMLTFCNLVRLPHIETFCLFLCTLLILVKWQLLHLC